MNTPSSSTPDGKPPLNLRGNRFKPLTWETLSPTQLTMVESVMAGQRGSMQGPYNVLLRSPELGNLAQQFGAHTRYNSSLPLVLNELAILLGAAVVPKGNRIRLPGPAAGQFGLDLMRE